MLAVVLSRKKGTITLKNCGKKCCKIEVILYIWSKLLLSFFFSTLPRNLTTKCTLKLFHSVKQFSTSHANVYTYCRIQIVCTKINASSYHNILLKRCIFHKKLSSKSLCQITGNNISFISRP